MAYGQHWNRTNSVEPEDSSVEHDSGHLLIYRRTRFGSKPPIVVEASADTRAALAELLSQYDLLLDPTLPESKRLFPTAYPNDPELEVGYQVLGISELTELKSEKISTFRNSIDKEELTEDEAEAWMIVLNDLRLVLGTKLDVGEDDDPSLMTTPEHHLYQSLSVVVGMIVTALAG